MTQSHWQATSFSLALDHALPTTADVVVIGGGIVGLSAAYWLARSGMHVVLLDQVSLSAGATGRNGGFVTVGAAMAYSHAIATLGHDAARSIWQLTYDNRDLLRALLAEENIACDYREPGTIHLARNEAMMRHLRDEIALLNSDGFIHELLDRAQVQACVHAACINGPLSDEIMGGSLLRGGGLLHPAKLVAGLARAAARHGARLCRARVMGIGTYRGVTGVETDRGRIEARGSIITTNAWTRELVPQMRDFITPVRGQVISFEPIETVFTQGFGIEITDTGEYWQQTPDGVIVLGGCRAAHATRDEDTLADGVTDNVQAALEHVLPRLFPALAGKLQVMQRWSGPMAFTPDRLPVADRVASLPNAWFAGGFCGHGMPFGIAFGKALADTVMGDRGYPAEALRAFTASRRMRKRM